MGIEVLDELVSALQQVRAGFDALRELNLALRVENNVVRAENGLLRKELAAARDEVGALRFVIAELNAELTARPPRPTTPTGVDHLLITSHAFLHSYGADPKRLVCHICRRPKGEHAVY